MIWHFISCRRSSERWFKAYDIQLVRDRSGGIIPMVRMKGQTLILPVWNESEYVPEGNRAVVGHVTHNYNYLQY